MTTEWTAYNRTDEGKGASRRLRRAGLTPGVIYGADKPARSVSFQSNTLFNTLEADAALFNKPLTVDVEGEQEIVVIKDLQRHPYQNALLHIDLQRIDENRKLIKRVPIKFEGSSVAPGVKMGAIMTFFQVDIEIRCFPKDLPEIITVDVSGMETDSAIRLSEVQLPDGVEITALLHGSANYDQAIVGVGKSKKK